METDEQKRRRLFGKQHLSEYIRELNALTKIEVTPNMLISIEESDKVVNFNRNYSNKGIIDFINKQKLSLLINELIEYKDIPCYLFTAYSNDCGLLKLESIKDFNENFNFQDEHSGFIKIILEDLSNEMILDFYQENNKHLLEIEIYGEDWAKAEI